MANEIVLSGELDFENEIIVSATENDGKSFAENEFSVSMIAECAETFIDEERFEDFGHMLKMVNCEENFRRLLEDEKFIAVYLKYKMHLQHYQEIVHILQNIECVHNPIFLKLWDDVHYQQYFAEQGRLTPMHKYRIRQRNPPPPGICPDGFRVPGRMSKRSVAVLREWFVNHSTNPYPCRTAKQALAKRAGISVTKVNNWFSNARRQQKNPEKMLDVKNKHMEMKVDKCVGTDEREESDPVTIEYYTDMDHSSENLELNNITERKMDENNNWTENTVSTGITGPGLFFPNNESVIPALNRNWLDTAPSVYQQNESITFGLREACNNAMDTAINQRIPFSRIQTANTIHYKNSREQFDERDTQFEKQYYYPNHADKKTCYIQGNAESIPYTDVKVNNTEGYTVYKCPYFGHSINRLCQKSAVFEDEIENKGQVISENEDAVSENKAEVMTASQSGVVTETDHWTKVLTGNNAVVGTKNEGEILAGNKGEVMTEIKTTDIGNNETGVMKGAMAKIMTENKTSKYKNTQLPKTRHKDAKVVGKGKWRCREIRPKRRFEETVSETKVKDMTSVWKLRVKLKERQMKQRGQKSEEGIAGEMTALECLRSIQKLCNNVDTDVKSPTDFACTVEITESLTDSDNDIFADEDNAVMNGAKLAQTDIGPESSKIGRTGNAMCSLCRREIKWYNQANTTEQYLLTETGVDSSTDFSSPRAAGPPDTGPDLYRDQLVRRLPDKYSNCPAGVTERPHARLPGTDKNGSLSSWNSEVGSLSFMEAASTNNGVATNADSYSRVVGEAIQGLLNLSSSQESDSSCLNIS